MGELLRPRANRVAWWPCGHGHAECARELVDEGSDTAAVCSNADARCPVARVPHAQTYAYALDREALRGAFRVGLAVDASLPALLPGSVATGLGSRRFGEVTVRFYFAAVPSIAALDAVRSAGPRDGGDEAVTLALVSAGSPTEREAAHALEVGIDVRPLAAWARLEAGGRVSFDLDAFVLRHRFVGLDPSRVLSPRVRLVLDPRGERAWFDGVALPFAEKAHLPFHLLVALARRPDALVTRERLYPEVWREDYAPSRLSTYGEAIRQHSAALRRIAPTLPLTTHAGNDVVGGFSLDLPGEAIGWWSDPVPAPVLRRKAR
jgi:two-component system response regulator RegX3